MRVPRKPLAAIAAAGLLAAVAPAVPAGASATPTSAWADHFNGTSLEARTWNNGWFGDGRASTDAVNADIAKACNVVGNVVVAKGSLDIRTTKDRSTCAAGSFRHSTALINTMGKRDVTVGQYVEARIRLDVDPTTGRVNNWPNFWLNGYEEDAPWPAHGEIDVLEGGPDGACHNVHFTDWETGQDGTDGGTCFKVDGEWHTYGVYRNPNGNADFFFDGQFIGFKPIHVDLPMYVVIGNTVTTAWGHVVKAPSDMLVDWVRVETWS